MLFVIDTSVSDGFRNYKPKTCSSSTCDRMKVRKSGGRDVMRTSGRRRDNFTLETRHIFKYYPFVSQPFYFSEHYLF